MAAQSCGNDNGTEGEYELSDDWDGDTSGRHEFSDQGGASMSDADPPLAAARLTCPRSGRHATCCRPHAAAPIPPPHHHDFTAQDRVLGL